MSERNKEKPTVSVVIPAYNRAHLLGRSIKSVLNQTYQDFDIIVVDDASTDNTKDVINEFQKKDERIIYFRHKKNKGASAARNTGIKAARGKYIAFQDSDDEWLPQKLEKQISVFKKASKEVGIVYTNMWKVYEKKRMHWHTPIINPADGIIYKQSLNRVRGIGLVTAMIKRECIDKTGGFDESLPRFIDLEFFIRVSKYYLFQHIDEHLVNFYPTKNNISSNNEVLITAYEYILKKHSYNIIGNRKSWASFQYLIGNTLCQTRKFDQGKKYLYKSFYSYPLGPRNLVAFLLSILGPNVYSTVIMSKDKLKILKKVLPPQIG